MCEERRGLLTDAQDTFHHHFDAGDYLKRILIGDFDAFGGMLSYILHRESVRQGELAGGEFRSANDAAMKLNSSIILGVAQSK